MKISEIEMIKKLRSLTGMDSDECHEILDDHDWDLASAVSSLKGGGVKKKKEKDKKIFKIGDWIKCIDTKPSKNMEPECAEFLVTYKKFRVKDVNEKLNIYLGFNLSSNGNPYYFSPNRFELLEGNAPVMKASDLNKPVEELTPSEPSDPIIFEPESPEPKKKGNPAVKKYGDYMKHGIVDFEAREPNPFIKK
jgi:hypothetical protein